MTAETVGRVVVGGMVPLPSFNEMRHGSAEEPCASVLSPELAMASQMEKIGTELRRVRQVRRLTQTDISRLAGISRVTVSKLESDFALYANSMLRHLAAYATVLGYTLRLVLVTDPAAVPDYDDEITALIREVAVLALSREDGWTACGPPDGCLSRTSVSYGGSEFMLLRDDAGQVSVYAAQQGEARLSIRSSACVDATPAGM